MNKGLFIITGPMGHGKGDHKSDSRDGCSALWLVRCERAAGVRDEIVRETGNGRVELHQLDLASVASIRSFIDG
ncbi:MAG: hypothetical protein ACLUDU_11395 [Butyricimonas faecihominis]